MAGSAPTARHSMEPAGAARPAREGMQATSGRPRSGHLGHVQVREREVELLDVRDCGTDVRGCARA